MGRRGYVDTAHDRLKGVGEVSIRVCVKAAVVTAAVAVQHGDKMVCILMSLKTHYVHTEHTSRMRRSHVNEQIQYFLGRLSRLRCEVCTRSRGT